MYHYKLQVLILSQDNRIYDAVSALEPLAGFEHELLLRQSADAAVKTADVIVCELSGAVLAELVKNSKPDAAIVFCAEPQTAEQLDAAVYQSLTDLWIRPCTEAFVAFRLHRLFEHIKIIKDCHLAQRYLDTGINSIPSLIWFKDIRGAHLKVNDSFCRAVGKTKADVEGRGHYYIWDMKKEEYEQGEYICLESEEIVLQEKKIIYSANTDQLTDLYNRRYFYEYMTRNKIMSKHVNLFYIDLDNFKKINDEYGHQAGDTVLVMVAKLLKQTFGAEFIARVGGDEFLAVVLGSKTDAELAILAERFLSSLQQTIADNAKFAVLSASIGIAVSNALTDVDLLIRQSDSALYEAKRNGKKQYKIYHK